MLLIGIGIGIPFDLRPLVVNVFASAAAAYSTRIPAGSTYSGPLIRVRRSSDNAEADVSAALVADANGNRWLDTSALLDFCGSGSGFVTTWYDQSGNGRVITQSTTTNQPTIVSAGAVNTVSGRPSLRFPAASVLLSRDALLPGSASRLLATVGRHTGALSGLIPWAGDGSNSQSGGMYRVGILHTGWFFWGQGSDVGPAGTADNALTVLSARYSGGTIDLMRNNASVSSAARSINTLNAVFEIGGLGLIGDVSEVVYTTRSDAGYATSLHRSQGLAFGITVA